MFIDIVLSKDMELSKDMVSSIRMLMVSMGIDISVSISSFRRKL
jgi:membrane protease subunit (stomatin/prohibitin family)